MAKKSDSKFNMTNVLLVLLSIMVLTMVCTIIYHLVDTSYETETAILATADESVVVEGVYIRDEEVLSYSGSGVLRYLVSDGGRAAVGDVIAEVYNSDSEIDEWQDLSDLEEQLELLQQISNVGTLDQAQPQDIADQMDAYYQEIVYYKDEGDIAALEEAEENYMEVASIYQIIVSDGEVNFDDQISDLEAEIAAVEATLADPIDTIVAEESCYFVSYADGYEGKLTLDSLDDLTPEYLEEVIESPTLTVGDNVAGKTIGDYCWYFAAMMDNSDLKYEVGDTITLRLVRDGSEVPVTITELRSYDDTDEVMAILYCEELTEEFVQTRTDQAELVLGEYEGIKVPRDAIRFQTIEETVTDEETGEETTEEVSYRGVYIEDGESVEFRKLDVIYEGEDYVLSDLDAGDGYLELYDSIIVEGIEADGD